MERMMEQLLQMTILKNDCQHQGLNILVVVIILWSVDPTDWCHQSSSSHFTKLPNLSVEYFYRRSPCRLHPPAGRESKDDVILVTPSFWQDSKTVGHHHHHCCTTIAESIKRIKKQPLLMILLLWYHYWMPSWPPLTAPPSTTQVSRDFAPKTRSSA